MIKICIPITGSNMDEINDQIEEMKSIEFDMIEWRVDYFYSYEALLNIKKAFPNKELLFTFRTKSEGGSWQPEDSYIEELYMKASETGLVDIIDIELFGLGKKNQDLISTIKENGLKILLSFHDFDKTPKKEVLVDIFREMEMAGADIGKIAVMPKTKDDVNVLIDAAM